MYCSYVLGRVVFFLFFCQALAGSADVAPFICGAVVGDAVLPSGGTWRGTLEVDETICPDPVYSVVTMLGESIRHSTGREEVPCSCSVTDHEKESGKG